MSQLTNPGPAIKAWYNGQQVYLGVQSNALVFDGTGKPPKDEDIAIRDGRIAWARLYLEEIEQEGKDIDETVRRMAGGEDP